MFDENKNIVGIRNRNGGDYFRFDQSDGASKIGYQPATGTATDVQTALRAAATTAGLVGADTATPTSSSTVVGETGGVVKRFAASDLVSFPSVRWSGAACDGTTNDGTDIAAAITDAGEDGALAWSGQSAITASVAGGTGQTHLLPRLIGDTATDFLWNAGNSGQTIISAELSGLTQGSGGSHGFGHTGGNRSDSMLIGSRIDVARYGVLINYDGLAAGATSDGLIAAANFIVSGFDGIELNGDVNNIRFNALTGNVIEAGTNQVGAVNAFGVGLSSTHYTAVVGNVFPASKSRALHVEDKQKGTVLAGNTGLTDGNGIYLVQDPATDAECDGVIAVGNHLTHTAASATSEGNQRQHRSNARPNAKHVCR